VIPGWFQPHARYVRCWPIREHSFARRCVRRMPGSSRVLVSPPSLHPSYQVSTVLCSDPTSQPPFASLASSTCRAYSSLRTRAAGISLVALLTSCVTRMGLRPRVSVSRSPCRDCRCCLPVWTYLGQDPRVTKFRGSIPFTAGQPVQSIHPRYLAVYASTRLLPDALQHSIPGLWLAVTRAGFPPACQQTISSPHVQHFVRCLSWGTSLGMHGQLALRPNSRVCRRFFQVASTRHTSLSCISCGRI
jgi:hypothetical protein